MHNPARALLVQRISTSCKLLNCILLGTELITVTRQQVMDDAVSVLHDFMDRPLSAQCRFRDVIFVGV